MSQEHVELADRLYDAVNRRDLEALLALSDDNIVLISILTTVEGGYHRHEGLRRWWASTFEAFPDYEITLEAIRDLGDRTLATLRLRGHGAGSGAPIDQALFQVIDWQRSKVIRMESFRSEAEALEALALPE